MYQKSFGKEFNDFKEFLKQTQFPFYISPNQFMF